MTHGALWRFALTLVAFLPVGCGSEPVPVPAVEGRDDVESITIGGELFYTNEMGIRMSQLRFDTAYQWTGVTERDLRGVDLLMFKEDGTERAHLTSERGNADFDGRQMKAIGGVILVTADGRRIESEELSFDPYQERIWSDVPFVSSSPGQSPIRGCSFTSDLEFKSISSVGGCW
jgi:LPS export ABC transporter protein LptC